MSTTDISEKGLEPLIMRRMTDKLDVRPIARHLPAEPLAPEPESEETEA